MNDDFIRGLQSDWQSQEDGTVEILRRLQRNRWSPHVILALQIVGCLGALLVGVWFAWSAAHNEEQRLLLALSAAVLLIAAPTLCAASVKARRDGFAWANETPEAMLQIGIRRADATLRAIRIGRWHLAVLACFVAVLWAAEALGLIQAIEFLILYTAICVIASLLVGFWMVWREKRVRGERDACIRMLDIMHVSDE